MVHMVPEGSQVLDIGCSTGTLGAVLKNEKNATVVGLDITKSDVEVASKVLDEAYVFDIENGDMQKEKFASRKYDVIIFADVLEHMKDPVAVLTKVKTILKPGGRIVFSIPNMAHMFVRLQLLGGKFTYTETGLLDYTHLHFYDDDEVNRIFTDANYVISGFDCTTFDYPDELLKEKLAALGLKYNKTFSEIAQQKQAVIFEYVGWAEPVSAKTKRIVNVPVGTSSPLDDVLAYVQRVKDAHKSENANMKEKIEATEQHAAKLQDSINQLTSQNEELAKELQRYKDHPLKAVGSKIINSRK